MKRITLLGTACVAGLLVVGVGIGTLLFALLHIIDGILGLVGKPGILRRVNEIRKLGKQLGAVGLMQPVVHESGPHPGKVGQRSDEDAGAAYVAGRILMRHLRGQDSSSDEGSSLTSLLGCGPRGVA